MPQKKMAQKKMGQNLVSSRLLPRIISTAYGALAGGVAFAIVFFARGFASVGGGVSPAYNELVLVAPIPPFFVSSGFLNES